MKVTVIYDSPDGSVTIKVTRQQVDGVLEPNESLKRFMGLARSAADECCDRAMELGLLTE